MGTWSRVNRYALTIPAGQTLSNIAIGWHTYGDAAGLTIHSPAVLLETVNIQVSPEADNPTNASQWNNYFDGVPLVQQTTPLAGDSAAYVLLVTNPAIRLQAQSPAALDRVFYLSYQSTF